MKRLLTLSLTLLLLGSAYAKPQLVPLNDLRPNENQRRASLVISQVLEGFHYKRPQIDDQLSHLAFDRYLESLDPNRLFFTQKDVDKFDIYRNVLDDSLLNGRLDPAFVIFRAFRQKVEQRVDYALKLLDEDHFDFKRNEQYVFDRKDRPWAANEAALNDLWRKRIKNDVLTARLSKDKASSTDLRKRYEGIRRRVDQMTPSDVFETFINAFALSIEPHTSYMSPRLSENFDIGMSLRLQGIGAVLRGENEYTEVVNTVVGGPAARSGKLAAGDRIVGVAQGENGEMEDVVGWRLQDVVELIRGPKDSVVRLDVLPKSEAPGGRTRELKLVRDEIKLEDKAAKSEILQGPQFGDLKIGVIDIPAFYRDFAGEAAGESNFRSTTRDVRALLKKLKKQGVDGIVIDLRENGGGSLTEATELTGLFITQGPVVQVKDARGNVEVERDTDPEEVYTGPLAVLVDRNSASASEIFAGAIQDYGRGLIIGEPTFGKGTVQTLLNLQRYLRGNNNAGRLRLTMAQFFRVEGASTQHRGVTPDIVFPTATGSEEHGERALEHALPWAAIKPAIAKPDVHFPLMMLRDKDAERVSKDPGFRFLVEQEHEFEKARDTKSISLNEDERRSEREQRDTRLLDSRNRLRAYRHLKPLASLDEEEERPLDEKDDKEGINRIMLDESAHILVDLIHAQRPLTAQTK
jgi:carboxyl-terminal processing protease